MLDTLKETFLTECFANIQTLQLSQADLPQKFEDALTATNVAIQENRTVVENLANVVIEMETQIKQAKISAPVVVNNAKAKKKASIDVNLAQVMAFQDVASKEAVAYGEMQTD